MKQMQSLREWEDEMDLRAAVMKFDAASYLAYCKHLNRVNYDKMVANEVKTPFSLEDFVQWHNASERLPKISLGEL